MQDGAQRHLRPPRVQLRQAAAKLAEAKDLILQGIAKEAQGISAAAWYYLARVYLP